MSTFIEQKGAGLKEAETRVQEAAGRVEVAREVLSELKRYSMRLPSITHLPDVDRQGIWLVDIPPTHPDHFDGERIVEPYGGVYFATLAEAAEFLDVTLKEIEGEA